MQEIREVSVKESGDIGIRNGRGVVNGVEVGRGRTGESEPFPCQWWL
jgi:hypothetical protein